MVATMSSKVLEGISSSGVFDVRGKQGAFPPQIQRLCGQGVLIGPARTAWCEEGSVSGVVTGLEKCETGDVLVIQGTGDWAYFGELTGAEAVRRGVIGLVADCYVRDLKSLTNWPIQVFAKGVTPKGAGFRAPGRVDIPLEIGPVTVTPGDWIVGDADGLVLIPAREVDAVLEQAVELVAREGRWANGVLNGVGLLDQRFDDGTSLRDRLGGSL